MFWSIVSSLSSWSLFSFFLFLLSTFLFLPLFSWLSDSNVSSVKIILNKLSSKFNNSFCLGVHLLYLIVPSFFILSNLFKSFLASILLIVLFLILLAFNNIKSLMLSYLNSPIFFLCLNLLLSIIAKISLNLFLSIQFELFIFFRSSLSMLFF